jgi:phosphoglycerate dehydrogenase-like enzyme
MPRVVVLDDYQGRAVEFADWASLGSDVEVTFVHEHLEPEELVAALDGVEVVVATRERTAFPDSLLEQLPALRLIATTGMMNASIDLKATARRGIVVSGTAYPSTATIEVAWGLILSLTRHIPQENVAIRAGVWQETIGVDLAGATLGLAGLGRLGAAMVPIAHGFGMDVIAWSANLDPSHATSLGVEAVSKDELLERSEVLSIHLVLSSRTRGLFGAVELAKLRPSAILINTSRGPIVDEGALIETLRARRIAGAGLDVYDIEPIPADHPLLSFDNTVLTPHLGYTTEATFAGNYPLVVENIAAYLAGSPIRIIELPPRS